MKSNLVCFRNLQPYRKNLISSLGIFSLVNSSFTYAFLPVSMGGIKSNLFSTNKIKIYGELSPDDIIVDTPLSHSTILTSLFNEEYYQKQSENQIKSKEFRDIKRVDTNVYCKMDALQPSGSFKDRGMAHMMSTLVVEKGISKFISSSGGNAGHAAALCGRLLNVPVHVIVPTTTKSLMLDKIRNQGAKVTVHGENWNAADILARQLVSENKETAYIPPYDDPLLWEGHATIVKEIISKLNHNRKENEQKVIPSAIICSVGGGGLLCGIYKGLENEGILGKNKKSNIKVIAVETEGAASFYEALKSKKVIKLPGIHTIATSLGALSVTEQAIEYGIEKYPENTYSMTVTDDEAINACKNFLNDHRVLVEPACGAAIATIYEEKKRQELMKEIKRETGPVVLIICGGSGINIEILNNMKPYTA